MDTKEKLQEQKDKGLTKILQSLRNANLTDKFQFEEKLKDLKNIYSGKYRHSYGYITSFLLSVPVDEINSIMNNLTVLHKYAVDENESESLQANLFKLSDHVNLEYYRLKDFLPYKNKIKEINEAVHQVKNLETEVKNTKKEYITILGIFAAIVVTFVGAFAFSTSVLTNIMQASPYRIVFIACLVGLFIVNILDGLYRFIKLLNGFSFKYWDKNNQALIFNIIVAVIMIVDFIAWMIIRSV
ncbi:hypothetical protein [Helicobacter sp. 11S02629-2]|uniref:hypothetical protein n=1 Tax=Helicobacter sp. 11S02629-2 TaxID=1476195 RepID=UPI000BA68327|nr:hypothetical protein [Helicobacter sp. 11S02629-2]PAF41290.1 hypothetical protein BKH40_08460 [Helicobacter sp. 11S02629-2]